MEEKVLKKVNIILLFLFFLTSFLQLKVQIFHINVYLVNFVLFFFFLKGMYLFFKKDTYFDFDNRKKFILLISFLTFVFILFSNLINFELSVKYFSFKQDIKYFIFLVFIPLSVILIRKRLSEIESAIFIKIVIYALVVYEVYLIFNIFLDNYVIDNVGNYYIAGEHKNATGLMLSIGMIFSLIYFLKMRDIFPFVTFVVGFALVLTVGCRAALFSILIVSFVIFLRYFKIKGVFFYILFFVTVGLINFLFLPKNILNSQFNRAGIAVNVVKKEVKKVENNKVKKEKQLTSASSRLVLWHHAIDIFKEHPLFGIGMGNYRINVNSWLKGRTEPHNGILQILSEGGVITFLGFVILIFLSLKRKPMDLLDEAILWFVLLYLIQGLVGIYWISGDGHIFWFLLFFYAFRKKEINETSST